MTEAGKEGWGGIRAWEQRTRGAHRKGASMQERAPDMSFLDCRNSSCVMPCSASGTCAPKERGRGGTCAAQRPCGDMPSAKRAGRRSPAARAAAHLLPPVACAGRPRLGMAECSRQHPARWHRPLALAVEWPPSNAGAGSWIHIVPHPIPHSVAIHYSPTC